MLRFRALDVRSLCGNLLLSLTRRIFRQVSELILQPQLQVPQVFYSIRGKSFTKVTRYKRTLCLKMWLIQTLLKKRGWSDKSHIEPVRIFRSRHAYCFRIGLTCLTSEAFDVVVAVVLWALPPFLATLTVLEAFIRLPRRCLEFRRWCDPFWKPTSASFSRSLSNIQWHFVTNQVEQGCPWMRTPLWSHAVTDKIVKPFYVASLQDVFIINFSAYKRFIQRCFCFLCLWYSQERPVTH